MVISLQKTNEAIRFIGQLAYSKKINSENINKWIEIRTHTARRSFATNAYLSGIPIRDIMQITGHRTTESFLKYIKVTKLETAEKLKDHPFFNLGFNVPALFYFLLLSTILYDTNKTSLVFNIVVSELSTFDRKI